MGLARRQRVAQGGGRERRRRAGAALHRAGQESAHRGWGSIYCGATIRARQPQVSRRHLREEGALSAGDQKVARLVAESSTQVRLGYNMKALEDQGLQKADLQAVGAVVAGTVSVQRSS